jgi:hypothetical protein
LRILFEFQEVLILYIIPRRSIQYHQRTNRAIVPQQWNASGEPYAALLCHDPKVLEAIVRTAICAEEVAWL